MKVPKLLLGAMLVGITVATTTSCSKKNHEVNPNLTEQANNQPENTPPIDPCPACGMG